VIDCATLTQNAGHVGCLCHRPEFHAVTRKVGFDLTRRGFVAGSVVSVGLLTGLGLPKRAKAQTAVPATIVLANCRLFDGTGAVLRDGVSLRIEGNAIAAVADDNPPPPEGAQVIDCGGRVLLPGLIDAHWHAMFAALPVAVLQAGDIGYIHLAAAAEAERTLMRGFTTVRDLGGPVFAFKQAIDEGLVPGPRIFPSGAMITASGGHGDLRALSELPRFKDGGLSTVERQGNAAIVDSANEVRLRVREQLLQGASQIKLVAGGGVSSPRSPLDIVSLSETELRAAVEVAEDWNTFVTVHAFTPETIQRAVAAGVRCIEHGFMMDDATAALLAERGIWLSTQPFLTEEDTVALTGPSQAAALKVFANTDTAYRLAIKHGLKTAWGSDMLFSPVLAARQGIMLTHLTNWYSNSEILRMATSGNADLLALSGPRNPYPAKLGVIEKGALADLLVVEGNPIEDIHLLEDAETNLALIMKDRTIFRNRLSS
jgi:imidazolonepropionase-like amidohydrolase